MKQRVSAAVKKGGIHMIIGMPYIWLGAVAILLVVEALTAGLTTIWFAGGALIAAIAAYFGASIAIQIILFLCVSILLVIFTRPLAIRVMNKSVTKTNVHSLIGKKAIVTREISNLAQTGQVRINDIEWKARTASDDIIIPEKAVVVIEEVNGVKLIVRQYREES